LSYICTWTYLTYRLKTEMISLVRFFLRRLLQRESYFPVNISGQLTLATVSKNNWFIVGPTVKIFVFGVILPITDLVL
jgi:hypothetical protein